MAATAPVYANEVVGTLSQETGLSERKVQMIVGNRTAFAEYTRSYDRSLAQFKRALGNERYQRLMAGQTIQVGEHRVALGGMQDRDVAAK
ncbi:hypothetical protein ASE43_10760 [Lysobacter sp. Root983]|nr:hypothetical protein ASE35_11040 [Lysobacter sp. Root916]KRD77595.1 hypothetical protein ASE43_10760 [Lysobacter sp. Root983]